MQATVKITKDRDLGKKKSIGCFIVTVSSFLSGLPNLFLKSREVHKSETKTTVLQISLERKSFFKLLFYTIPFLLTVNVTVQ